MALACMDGVCMRMVGPRSASTAPALIVENHRTGCTKIQHRRVEALYMGSVQLLGRRLGSAVEVFDT